MIYLWIQYLQGPYMACFILRSVIAWSRDFEPIYTNPPERQSELARGWVTSSNNSDGYLLNVVFKLRHVV